MSNKLQEGLIFFTDLTNFNHTTRNMKLEEVAKLLTNFANISNQTVSKGGGKIVDYMLDSALGYFPAEEADLGVRTVMKMKANVEEWLTFEGHKMKLRVAAHFGHFMQIYLPPFETPDIIGDAVNTTISLGSGGQSFHRGKMILTVQAFRKLDPETRKSFHKFTEPIVYLAEQ